MRQIFAAIAGGLILSASAPASASPSDAPYAEVCTIDLPTATVGKTAPEILYFDPDRGPLGSLVVCLPAEDRYGFVAIDNPDAALALLSIKDLAPLWPSFEAEWGNDLGLLRDAHLADAMGRTERFSEWPISRRVDRAIGQSRALGLTGRTTDAYTLVDETLESLITVGSGSSDRLDFERLLLVLNRASLIHYASDAADSASYIEAITARMPEMPDYALNLIINRAAFLAESGQYDAARALIEPAYAEYEALKIPSGSAYKVSGSDREFAWIMACISHGLGNTDEVEQYRKIVASAPERPRDSYLSKTKSSSAIELRMYRCMGDADGYFSIFVPENLPVNDTLWLNLQDANDQWPAPLSDWAKDADLQSRFAQTYRQLPARYTPALRNWRGAQ